MDRPDLSQETTKVSDAKREYAYSFDGETYHGKFATAEEAIAEGFASSSRNTLWIGEAHPPIQPEDLWDTDDWLEHVSCQDEYLGDWAEDWDESTDEQREELEREVRAVVAAWLDRHGLRPRFFTIKNERKVTREDSQSE